MFVCTPYVSTAVIPLLPRLFQVIVIVNQYGPRLLHEAVHGLTVNILHALCLWADDIEEGEDCPFSSSRKQFTLGDWRHLASIAVTATRTNLQ